MFETTDWGAILNILIILTFLAFISVISSEVRAVLKITRTKHNWELTIAQDWQQFSFEIYIFSPLYCTNPINPLVS